MNGSDVIQSVIREIPRDGHPAPSETVLYLDPTTGEVLTRPPLGKLFRKLTRYAVRAQERAGFVCRVA